MNVAASEVSVEPVIPAKRGERMVTRFDGQPDTEMKATTFECLFCRSVFEELPFWGCCSGCYTTREDVRALVDEAHPQTVRQ